VAEARRRDPDPDAEGDMAIRRWPSSRPRWPPSARAGSPTPGADRRARHLRLAYDNLARVELLRRRLSAKAERIRHGELELEFAGKLAALDALNRELGLPELTDGDEPGGAGPIRARAAATPTPTGRATCRGRNARGAKSS